MKGFHYNTYLITGLDKIDAFSFPPFSTYLTSFAYDMLESEYIILIGLSFNDYHLHAYLTNTIFTLKTPEKKIVIVTKEKIDNLKKDEENPEKNLIAKLRFLFNAKKAYDGNLLLENLEKFKFTSIMPNIYLYIDGTKKFYEFSMNSL